MPPPPPRFQHVLDQWPVVAPFLYVQFVAVDSGNVILIWWLKANYAYIVAFIDGFVQGSLYVLFRTKDEIFRMEVRIIGVSILKPAR